MRFVQALGGAGSIVLARAVVRDLYSGVRAGRELSLMGSITAFAPIVAPVIGGILQTAFGWRSSFVLLVIFAAVAGIGRRAAFAGDFAPAHAGAVFARRHGRPVSLGAGASRLSRQSRHFDHEFRRALCLGFGSAGRDAGRQLRPVAGRVRRRPSRWAPAGYMLGTFLAARIVMRLGLDRTMGIGTVVHGGRRLDRWPRSWRSVSATLPGSSAR